MGLLQDNKILDQSKLKAFANNKKNVTQKLTLQVYRLLCNFEENERYDHSFVVPQSLCACCCLGAKTGISFLQPFPKRQILDYSKMKQFADDNFKFDEMGESSPKK